MKKLRFWRPDRTPALVIHELAREYRAGPPFGSFVALNERAVRTYLVRRGISPGRGVDAARIIGVFHCLSHRIVFGQFRQVLSLRL